MPKPFIERYTLFFASSTLVTATLTVSPTPTTEETVLTYSSPSSEMCTRPVRFLPSSRQKAPYFSSRVIVPSRMSPTATDDTLPALSPWPPSSLSVSSIWFLSATISTTFPLTNFPLGKSLSGCFKNRLERFLSLTWACRWRLSDTKHPF